MTKLTLKEKLIFFLFAYMPLMVGAFFIILGGVHFKEYGCLMLIGLGLAMIGFIYAAVKAFKAMKNKTEPKLDIFSIISAAGNYVENINRELRNRKIPVENVKSIIYFNESHRLDIIYLKDKNGLSQMRG